MNPEQRAALRCELNPGWQVDGLCSGTDLAMWFPDHGQEPYDARQLCVRCPVRRACLAAALLTQEHGVWAGTTEVDRTSGTQLMGSGASAGHVLDLLLTLPTLRYRYRRTAA